MDHPYTPALQAAMAALTDLDAAKAARYAARTADEYRAADADVSLAYARFRELETAARAAYTSAPTSTRKTGLP